MPPAIFTFKTTKTRKGVRESCTHTITTKESRKLSKFQALGFLLGWVDALASDESDIGRSIGAMLGFDAEVAALGFEPYDPVHILTAPNWKTRMLVAWCVIGSTERTIAQQLDYTDMHNYWMTTDFRDPGWDDEAKQWAASGAGTEVPFEFSICSVVGNPARPQAACV